MVKVLVSLDESLVDRLDREAVKRGMSRSALIAELTATALGEPRGPGARPEVRAALARTDALFREFERRGNLPDAYFQDSTALIRADRDAH